MPDLKLESIRPWAPHPAAAPLTERSGDTLAVAANGTRTCIGGWQVTYSGAAPGTDYLIRFEASHEGIERVRDSLQSEAYWGEISLDESRRRNRDVVYWEFLVPEETGAHSVRFSRCLTAPEGADRLTLRCTFRWSTAGSVEWRMPEVEAVPSPGSRPEPVQICVVTGRKGDRKGPFETVQDNIDYYAPLCEAACRAEQPDLIVLPEIALQWGISGSPLDLAVPAPGPETDAFAQIARRYGLRILLGMLERDADAVHNSAVLLDPGGGIEGIYRKVHLAVGGEIDTGILPGDGFPVFDTAIGRIGCNICMDSSAAESSRMVGLNGADFLLLPIMGDHRAWHPEDHVWDPERFKAIMRTRAMDNQLCMVVAVNATAGSCIIDRVGQILAWNDGDRDSIQATVTLADGFRPSSRGCYRGVNWMQRRPHAYGEFVEEFNRGGLLTRAY